MLANLRLARRILDGTEAARIERRRREAEQAELQEAAHTRELRARALEQRNQ